MRVVEFNEVPHFQNGTLAAEHMGKLLGTKTHVLSQVIKLRKDLTFSLLTEGLKRVYSMEKSSSFTASEALVFEWKLDTTQVPRIQVVEACTADGRNKQPFTIILEKNFYAANDTFALENQQQLFVRQAPEQLGPNRWRYVVNLVGNNMNQGLDTRFTTIGRYTQYRSNYHPEMSERGSNKFTYNVEIHRGYLSRHRQSLTVSGDMQAIYFEIGSKDKGNAQYFWMTKPEKHLLDLFLLSRENSIVFGKSNHDVNGKCLDFDDQGRAIPMGKLYHCPLAA